jgi:hypothetical protein
MQFDVTILDSTGQVAERASRKLISDGALQAQFPPVLLRAKLDSELSSRWKDGHVAVSALWEDFARYVYLPRLKSLDVLVKTAEKGPASVTWASEGFGVAAGISEDGKYLGLVGGADPGVLAPTALLVRPEVTQTQLDQAEEEKPGGDGNDPDPDGGGDGDGDGDGGGGTPPVPPQKTTSFRGTVSLDPNRSARAFGQVSEEVLTHLISQVGVDVEITVIIVAKKDEGFSPKTIRDVTENSQTLKFDDGSGFTTD